jgi:RNA polymerase sigma-54 factor
MARQRDGLTLRQQQRLTLTPEIRTTLSVLRMSGTALRDVLEAEAAKNPILSLAPRFRAHRRAAGPSAYDVALDTTGAEVSLGDRIRTQLGLMGLAPPVHHAALVLSWSLDDAGYLEADLSDLAAEFSLPLPQLEAGLAALQECEPTGVGARSLAECLALQLADHGVARAMADRAMQALDKLAAGDLARAARTTGLARGDLDRIARVLPDLTPYPGQSLQPGPRLSLPDVEVRFPEGRSPEITILSGTSADLSLDQALLGAARQESDDTALARYGAEAEALYRALAYRTTALQRIVAWIVGFQTGFFRHGGRAMLPLTRDRLAQELGLHPTTVGRAVADKTLAHPGGLIPLSAFFTPRLGKSPHDAVSAFGVQTRIAELVAGESEDAILTDDDIAHKLKDDSVDIARRTVAKYRRCLNIPSSYDRKRLRAAARMRGRTGTSG